MVALQGDSDPTSVDRDSRAPERMYSTFDIYIQSAQCTGQSK